MSKVRRRFQFGMSSLVLLMTVACVGVGIYLTRASKIEVLVATTDLNYNTKISETNVKFASWPAEIVPEGAITSTEGIPEGKVIVTRLRKGQALIGDDVVQFNPPRIPPGYKVVNVRVKIFNGSNGMVRPGDRGDVIAVDSDGTEESTKTILKNVRVFNVGQGVTFSIVGLLVTEKQATAIKEAKAIGKIEFTPPSDAELIE